MKPYRSMIRRILAWLGITPARGYVIQPDDWTSRYDWMCCECRSGAGSSSNLNDAHRAAQIHMLAAHGGQEARA